MALEKTDLEYIKQTIEWLNEHTVLIDDNRTNCEMLYNSVQNSLQALESALTECSHEEKATLPINIVSGSYSVDFGGHCKAKFKIDNGEPKVEAAMNGWGDGISLSDITIEKL